MTFIYLNILYIFVYNWFIHICMQLIGSSQLPSSIISNRAPLTHLIRKKKYCITKSIIAGIGNIAYCIVYHIKQSSLVTSDPVRSQKEILHNKHIWYRDIAYQIISDLLSYQTELPCHIWSEKRNIAYQKASDMVSDLKKKYQLHFVKIAILSSKSAMLIDISSNSGRT